MGRARSVSVLSNVVYATTLLLATGWSAGNLYTFFMECFDFDIMFLILFFDTVCCYTSRLLVVVSNTYNYILSY
jgi:hypothetical protein